MNIKQYILIFAIITVCLAIISCSELEFGNNFLDNQPESSGANLDTMFHSAVNADKVLTKAYTYLPYGLPTASGTYSKLGFNILEAITDLHYSFRNNISDGPINLYYNGALGANISATSQNSEAYRFGSGLEYSAIRYSWIYIENSSKIPDITESVRNERNAEAKMIIAISYAEMLRYMGGVPLLKHSIDVNEPMHFTRNTFEETLDYIVELLDEAIPHLNWKKSSIDDGRMTKAGAMALKLRMLLFAASPTFNSEKKWHPEANEYTCYGNYSSDRWERAVKAGEDFFKELSIRGEYSLTIPETQTPEARRLAYRSGYYDRGGTEVLISTRRSYTNSILNSFYNERSRSGPTLNYVNMFPWADGVDFPENFSWESPSKQPFFDEDGTPTRDPRLYENVTVPGDVYFNGTIAPLHINHPNFQLGSGFFQMKFILQNNSDRDGRPIQWPYIRLPEVMLSYAEAINEYEGAPNAIAYEYVNKVRERVGLSKLNENMSQREFREAILCERALEFGFEEIRWFDLIRWGREADFRKKLYGLTSIGNYQNNPTKFEFRVYELSDRLWVNIWDTKWFLSPVPQTEINKDYGMTQNPGWQ